jgi:serine/threonine-protein kinase HipA
MSGPVAFVHIELAGKVRVVGRLWTKTARGRESATFEFDDTWRADPVHHVMGPALPATPGPFFSGEGRAMFGALGDSAPDRWGRRLITRNEARRAREKKQTPRAPREIDFLLGVSDITRQGALRFTKTIDGPFIAGDGPHGVPPLIILGTLLHAARALENDPDSATADEAARLLLAPGSSLGGARPKASVRDRDGSLAIAKFPESRDDIDVVRWEAVMLAMAKRAGITVSASRIEMVGETPVLLLRRFDRDGATRIPFLSAMSLLDANHGEARSYVEIIDAVRRVASQASADGPQLWRRLAFNILASNFDDHLRNHAVIYDGIGWRLSPAYDLNPVPRSVNDRLLATAIDVDQDTTASIELAVEASREFFLLPAEARAIAREVATSIEPWRTDAAHIGISVREIERMESAFEHCEADLARGWES